MTVTFNDAVSIPVGDSPVLLTLNNFDNNNWPDLAAIDSAELTVLLGDGTSQFGSLESFDTEDNPLSVALGDINRDNILDRINTNREDDTISVIFGEADGNFGLAESSESSESFDVGGDEPISLAVDDINKDGLLDVATANFKSDNISVLLGAEDGYFNPPEFFKVGDGPFSLMLEDIDNDGNLDLINTNRRDDKVSVRLGLGDGDFNSPEFFDVGDEPILLAVGDINGDGLLDIATANFKSDDVSVLINTTPIEEISKPSASFTMQTADFWQMLDNGDCTIFNRGICENIIIPPLGS